MYPDTVPIELVREVAVKCFEAGRNSVSIGQSQNAAGKVYNFGDWPSGIGRMFAPVDIENIIQGVIGKEAK